MAIHTYSPASPASQRERTLRSLHHIELHPANGGVIVEHHHQDGDGAPSGAPDRYIHATMAALHDHLDEHADALMPSGEHGPRAPHVARG